MHVGIMCHVGTMYDGLEIMYTCGGDDQQPDRCGLKIIDAMGNHCFVPISSHMTGSISTR